MLGRLKESIAAYKEAVRLNPHLLIMVPKRRDTLASLPNQQEGMIFHAAIASQARQVTPQPSKPVAQQP